VGKYAQYVTYKGKRILCVNAARLPGAECLLAFDEMEQALLKESGVLVLIDVSHLQINKTLIDKAKAVSASITDAKGYKYKPSVVVGLTTLQKSVARLFDRRTHYADTVEEGKEWLVKEDDKRQGG
jgi:hypothetical protein